MIEQDIESGKWICQLSVPSKTPDGADAEPKICGEGVTTSADINLGTRAFNLMRHVRRFHPQEHKKLEEKQEESRKEVQKKKGLSVSKTSGSSGTGQRPITSFGVTCDKIVIHMTKEVLIDSIVRMVVKNGVPFRFFSEDGYKRAHGEMAEKLGVSLDRDAIKQYVLKTADKMKENLKLELKKTKLLHLKLDCATRIRTNYVGITIRFIDSNTKEPVTRTLAVKDTEAQHTALELKALLEKILQEFDIPMSKIVCCVTDNASNMVKMLKDINRDAAAAPGEAAQLVLTEEEDFDYSQDENDSTGTGTVAVNF